MLLTKRLISLKKISTGLESKGGKKFYMQMDLINRQEYPYDYLTKYTSD
jgi:hypothetical protein